MPMRISTKAGAPLVEIVFAIGIFACTGILTIRLFLTASYMERFASDANIAVSKAQSVIEYVKAYGEIGEDAYVELGIRKNEATGNYEQCFDRNWNSTEDNAEFVMNVVISKEKTAGGTMISERVTVNRCQSYPFLKESRDHLADLSNQQYFAG